MSAEERAVLLANLAKTMRRMQKKITEVAAERNLAWTQLDLYAKQAEKDIEGCEDGDVDPPPDVVEIPEATWTGSPDGTLTRLADGQVFPGSSSPMISSWYGADKWSSSSKNRQPAPGKKPGDVLVLAPGDYDQFRITLSYDLDVEAIKQNPEREGDPVNYPGRTFTYLNDDGTLRYGMNNRDALKGLWTKPMDGYPAWFKWGHDPQTWIVGATLDEDGMPTTIIQSKTGSTYGEWIGACSMARLMFKGPSAGAILQAENPVARDKDGNFISENWPDDPRATHAEWQGFRDWELFDCWIDGGWDWNTSTGVKSKWGFLNYELGRSARGLPGFRWIGGGVRGIWEEHAFYFHNVVGDVQLQGMVISGCGRTAMQFASRLPEGPEGRGTVTIKDVDIQDVCLGDGGSAISINGGHKGKFVLDNVYIELGGNPNIHPDYQQHVTGCLVSHRGGGASTAKPDLEVNKGMFLVGRVFQGEGSYRRPNVALANLGSFKMRDTTIRSWPGAREALVLDLDTIDAVDIDESTIVYGDCVVTRGGIKKEFKDPTHVGIGYTSMLDYLKAEGVL